MTNVSTAGAGWLSVGQQALWFFQQLSPDSAAYHMASGTALHFAVDADRLAAAVHATIARYPVLGCVVALGGSAIRRRPAPAAAGRLFAVYQQDGDDDQVRSLAGALAQQPFHLDREPPIRFALIRRTRHPDVLLLAAHHIAADHPSQLMVLRAVLTAYGKPGIDTVDTGFDVFVGEQRAYLESPRAGAAATYWRRELERAYAAGASPGLPTDHPRPAVYRFAGSEVRVPLPDELMTSVDRAAAAHGTTPFVFLLAAFQLLLVARSGRTDLLLGYPVSLRTARYAEAVGYLVNTLPLYARVDPAGDFGALLAATGRKVLGGLLHRDYPFALMPRLVPTRRAPDQAGLVSTMFVLTGPHPDQIAPGVSVTVGGLRVSEFYLPQQQGQGDLTLQIFRNPTGSFAALKFNTSLFTAATAEALAGEYVRTVRAAADGTLPDRLGALTLRKGA